MKITIAKTSGFCMGVRRAVEMVLETSRKHPAPIYTYGPLIHNPQVMELLREKGIETLTAVPENGSGTVLIRAHGVPPDVRKHLETSGFDVIDATCPRVIRVQTIIARHARLGHAVIIVGDRDHPEVIGLLGYSGREGFVVGRPEDLSTLPALDQAIIVAQTTQNKSFFEAVQHWAQKNHPHYKVFDTICDSTAKRQQEVKRLAASVDALVVVGGRNSGNTQRLAEVGQASETPTYAIETEDELNLEALAPVRRVGITAGASTPNWIIKRVSRQLEKASLKGSHRLVGYLFELQRTLLLTNIYVSLGAGGLCYAGTHLAGTGHKLSYVLIAMLYVLSMHILNNLTGKSADRYNDPDRAAFYRRNEPLLALLAVIAGGAGLLTAYTLGAMPFVILLAMSLLGLSYNLRLLPVVPAGGRIRDIPGSKTVLITLAWGVVTVVLPQLADTGAIDIGGVAAAACMAGLVFVRTAFFDLLDIQGDRIVGQETIPILLGEHRALRLLKAILVLVFTTLAAAGVAGFWPPLSLGLCICPLAMGMVLALHIRGLSIPGIRIEFLMETTLLLAGGITLLGSLLGGMG